MIAIDKFIQIVRLCGNSIGIGISISIGIDIGIVIGVIFLGWNICYYLILDVFSSLDSLFAEIYTLFISKKYKVYRRNIEHAP